MIKRSTSLQAALAAAVGLSAGWLGAQVVPGPLPDPKLAVPESRPAANEPRDVNKASKLVGIDVWNQSGEKLGTVKDLVIDIEGDRIVYCVLAFDPGFFQTEKLHAVPLQAFKPNPNGNALILNADKGKLAMSEGFSPDHWPSVTKREWGAQPFWRSDQATQGTEDTGGTSK